MPDTPEPPAADDAVPREETDRDRPNPDDGSEEALESDLIGLE